jgi:lysophospholipase L1-like esterase
MPQHELRVIFFGDSFCVGPYVALHRGWVARLSSELSALGDMLGRRIVVANASANGRTTRQALEAMPYEVQSHRPDVLLVQFGLNDCNYWKSDGGVPRVSRNAFKANIEEIVMRGRVAGARQVFLHTNHPTMRSTERLIEGGPTLEASNRSYNAAIREIAADLGAEVYLCDLEEAFNKSTAGAQERLAALLLEDGLHLSESGHDMYFRHLYPSLSSSIEKLARDDIA